jgi:hypothetical protein
MEVTSTGVKVAVLALASACALLVALALARDAWLLYQAPLRPTPRVLMLGPTTGTSIRPSGNTGYYQDEHGVWHYVSNGQKVTLRWATPTKIEHRNATNSGPAKETR